jgi:hypothetical protein
VQVITALGNAHRTILAHLPNTVLSMDVLQPGIGINERGKRREAWERWECDTGWQVATGKRLVRSLCIVVVQEAGGDLTHLLQCLVTMHLDALLVKRSMVSFHKRVGPSRQLHRLPL